MSLELSQNKLQINHHHRLRSVAYVLRKMLWYAKFCKFFTQVHKWVFAYLCTPELPHQISPICTQCSYNALLACLSMFRYSNPFRNASVTNESMSPKNADFAYKFRCHGNVLWAIAKWLRPLSNPLVFLPTKIWWRFVQQFLRSVDHVDI